MSMGLLYALARGGKALVMSKTVRLALARYIIERVKKHEAELQKPEPEAPEQEAEV